MKLEDSEIREAPVIFLPFLCVKASRKVNVFARVVRNIDPKNEIYCINLLLHQHSSTAH